MLLKKAHTIWKILTATVQELSANDPLRMAGATAFFTSFALPPIVMIIVRILGIFLDKQTLGRQLSNQLRAVFGPESTGAIMMTIRSFRELQHNLLITTGLFIFLLFVATTLFKVIKNSIDQIWNIRKVPGRKVLYGLKSRLFALAVILLGGILFLGMQLIDAGQHWLAQYLPEAFPNTVFYFGIALNEIIVLILSALWFFVLFSLLPDGKPHRNIAIVGALLTSILFNTGKWVLQILLQPGHISNFYGASGALVLVLLFVFYSSIILYFGAAFIKVWGRYRQRPLHVKPGSVNYRMEQITID